MNSEYLSPPDELRGVSEITILPDGRIYVLGLSKELAALLDVLNAAACETQSSQTIEQPHSTSVHNKP